MKFNIKSGSPEKQRVPALVIGLFDSEKLSLEIKTLDKATDGFLSKLIKNGDLTGAVGKTFLFHKMGGVAADRLLFVGLGKAEKFNEGGYQKTISTAIKALKDTGAKEALLCLPDVDAKKHDAAWRVRQAVIAARDANYRFDQFKSKTEKNAPPLQKIGFLFADETALPAAETGLAEGIAIADGIDFCKDLGNTPPNICHPEYLAEKAVEMAKSLGLKHEVLDEKAMQKLGMNALLAVARGSAQKPKLIVLSYQGATEKTAPMVLVGKGVTFDSGGISLKPAAGMEEMKFDMGGAASVLGTIKAVAQLKLPINLNVIIPAVENMPDGNACRPSDIVTTMSGQTVEIVNTDAEGRLILCDALTYAEKMKPQFVIDVATLTGACVVALGHVACGLYSNKESLTKALLLAGETAWDRAWHLPLWDDYQDALKSDFADMINAAGRDGGSITAACYLSRFTKKYDWAHLDIAGIARHSGKEKGATGRPVSLLCHFLLAHGSKKHGE